MNKIAQLESDLYDLECYLAEQCIALRETPMDNRDVLYDVIGGLCQEILDLKKQIKDLVTYPDLYY